MFIYNITLHVDKALHEDWINWMQNTFFSHIENTGLFHEKRVLRVLEAADEEGITYALQFHAHTLAACETFQAAFSADLQKLLHTAFQDSVIFFDSIMQALPHL